MKYVSVFGGSKPKPGEKSYQEALQLGKSLAESGFTVLTGGYIGTMEAVSRGASESGADVIGVTCVEIEAFRSVGPNPWVMEERRFTTLRERIFALMDGCDAAMALPGGPGTLTEIAITWNHLLIGAIAPRPLILIGNGWRDTFQGFFRSLDEYITEDQRRWLTFAKDAEEAVKLLNTKL